jgi:chromate transporter
VLVPLWAPWSPSLVAVFLVFLKIGSVIYGSGYVLLAFLETDVVGRGWVSERVLIDAVAVGQITPGPVFTTATFIGWQLRGAWGALARRGCSSRHSSLPGSFRASSRWPIVDRSCTTYCAG